MTATISSTHAALAKQHFIINQLINVNVVTAVDAVHANQDCKLEAKGVAVAEHLEFIIVSKSCLNLHFQNL